MIHLDVLEIYITNVCNLTCRGCNRFNNYNFKGHHLWRDHADKYEEWSKRIAINKISIIGGEPTLNPDLELWAMNLRRLWPDSDIKIQTNGTYIRPNFAIIHNEHHVHFAVSLHDITTADDIIKSWKQLLGSQFDTFLEGFVFHTANIIEQDDHFILDCSNDKHTAFNACDMKHDHTMYQGNLYKCPSMALYPEFNNQFDLRLSNEQQELLNRYRPLSADCTEEELQQFVSTRDTPIDQCSLCSSSYTWHTAYGETPVNLPDPSFNQVTPPVIQFYKNRLTAPYK